MPLLRRGRAAADGRRRRKLLLLLLMPVRRQTDCAAGRKLAVQLKFEAVAASCREACRSDVVTHYPTAYSVRSFHFTHPRRDHFQSRRHAACVRYSNAKPRVVRVSVAADYHTKRCPTSLFSCAIFRLHAFATLCCVKLD